MIEKQKLLKRVIVTELNCGGLNKNEIEILDILEKTQVDIACLNKTSLDEKNFPNSEIYILAENTKHSRLGSEIYIKYRLR